MTPVHASKKVSEKIVFSHLRDKTRKFDPNFEAGDLVRTSDIRSVLNKGGSTNYNYESYTIPEVIHVKSLARESFFFTREIQ